MTTPAAEPAGAAFYCVADERYFLGATAMINSLRLQGHGEPVYVLDAGLTPGQRELLERETIVVDGPATAPWLAKTVAPLRHPAATMILIDADMIVTRRLDELLERAGGGSIVAFENDRPRFVPEWGELLELGEARPGPYVSSGLVALGGAPGREVLRLLDDRQRRVDLDRTIAGEGDRSYAFVYPEQDVLNAILRTRVDPRRLVVLGHHLAPTPPFDRLRLVDERRLRCAHPDGLEPYVLHQFVRRPWLERMYHGIYSRLFARLLLADDVAIRLPADQVPRRMRDGLLARVDRALADVVDLGRWHLIERRRRDG
jgi:hypothetical protein